MEEAAYAAPTGKMLVIDDDPSFGQLISTLAESRGLQTHYVSSLLDLGSFARIKEYEVALIDYFLGNLRGDEIAQYVEMFFQDIPVVIVSGNNFSAEEVDKWPASVKRFVAKSEGPYNIIDRVISVLERERLLKKFQN